MSRREAEGECKDGILQPAFPESTSISPRCVPNPKPTPQQPLQEQQLGVCRGNAGGVFQLSVCALPWRQLPVKDCLSDC